MLDEEIKSPLPPRRFSTVIEDETTAPPPAAEPALKEAAAELQTTQPPVEEVIKSQPVEKKGKSKLPMILGVVIGLLMIMLLIVKVVLPKVGKGGVGGITLNYWGLWEEPAVIEGIIMDYENKNPGVKINYV